MHGSANTVPLLCLTDVDPNPVQRLGPIGDQLVPGLQIFSDLCIPPCTGWTRPMRERVDRHVCGLLNATSDHRRALKCAVDESLRYSSLRDPTGLDDGARLLIMNVVEQNPQCNPTSFWECCFEDRFGSFEDFYLAVGNAHGYEARRQCEEAVAAANEHLFGYEKDAQAPFRNLLLAMPEHDFMLAVEEVAFKGAKTQPIASRI